MNNITLNKNQYYLIKRNGDESFFGMYYEEDKHNQNRPMFVYNIFFERNITRDKQLSPSSITYEENWDIENISHENWKYIMKVLITNRRYFEQGIGVEPAYIPSIGKLTFYYNVENGESGFGIYQKSPNDQVCMFTYTNKGNVYFENLSYEIGNSSDIYFKKPSRTEEDDFNTLLSFYGKQWSYAARRVILSDDYKIKAPKNYYYINDRFTISQKIDNSGTDGSRFLAGNYFSTPEEAQEVLAQFNKILMKRQASIQNEEPLKGKSPDEIFDTDETGNLVKRKKGRPW